MVRSLPVEGIIHRGGQPVVGFGLGALWSPDWQDTHTKLAAMDRLIAEGRGDVLVEGGGCTEPGGGIVPTRRTAREMAALLRTRVDAGLGDPAGADGHMSAWKFAVVTSVVGAATGWIMEEIAQTFRKRRGRRR